MPREWALAIFLRPSPHRLELDFPEELATEPLTLGQEESARQRMVLQLLLELAPAHRSQTSAPPKSPPGRPACRQKLPPRSRGNSYPEDYFCAKTNSSRHRQPRQGRQNHGPNSRPQKYSGIPPPQ